MRKFVAIICFFLAGCATKEQRPANVLSKPEMVKALSDMYLMEERVNRLGLPRDSAEQVAKIFTAKLFAEKSLSDSTFKRSVDYYLSHPQEMEDVYAALVDSLNLHEQRLNIKSQQKTQEKKSEKTPEKEQEKK